VHQTKKPLNKTMLITLFIWPNLSHKNQNEQATNKKDPSVIRNLYGLEVAIQHHGTPIQK
jgi:hypothetical protein